LRGHGLSDAMDAELTGDVDVDVMIDLKAGVEDHNCGP
jgi:hypothetical protein